MRKLSEITPVEKYAYCQNCKEWFIDDMLLFGDLYCPNAECKYIIMRCLTSRTVATLLLEQQNRKSLPQ